MSNWIFHGFDSTDSHFVVKYNFTFQALTIFRSDL